MKDIGESGRLCMDKSTKEWNFTFWWAKGQVYIGLGWEKFVSDLSLVYGDVIHFYYIKEGIFVVRVIRDGVEKLYEGASTSHNNEAGSSSSANNNINATA